MKNRFSITVVIALLGILWLGGCETTIPQTIEKIDCTFTNLNLGTDELGTDTLNIGLVKRDEIWWFSYIIGPRNSSYKHLIPDNNSLTTTELFNEIFYKKSAKDDVYDVAFSENEIQPFPLSRGHWKGDSLLFNLEVDNGIRFILTAGSSATIEISGVNKRYRDISLVAMGKCDLMARVRFDGGAIIKAKSLLKRKFASLRESQVSLDINLSSFTLE